MAHKAWSLSLPMNHEDLILSAVCTVLERSLSSIAFDENFVAQGGDSLRAVSLSLLCKPNGVYLPVPVILSDVSISNLLEHAKTAFVYESQPGVGSSTNQINYAVIEQSIHPHNSGCLKPEGSKNLSVPSELHYLSTYPNSKTAFTEIQHALIQGSWNAPGSNIISFMETYDSQNVHLLKKAWRMVIESEPIFKLYGSLHDPSDMIRIHDMAHFVWSEVIASNERDYELEMKKPSPQFFVGSWFKAVTLPKAAPARSITTIIWHVHHALIDGWSAALLYKKVRAAVEGRHFEAGNAFAVVAKGVERLHAKSAVELRGFWTQKHAEFPSTASELGLQSSSGSQISAPQRSDAADAPNGKSIAVPVDLESIKLFLKRATVTIAALYCSAWAIALSQYADADTVVFGIVTSGRSLPVDGAHDAIGPLINTLPLYIKVDQELSAAEFVKNCFRRIVQLHPAQCSVPGDGFSRSYSSVLAQRTSFEYEDSANIKPLSRSSFSMVSEFPISILFDDTDELCLCYHGDRFQSSDITALGEHLSKIVKTLTCPQTTVQDCVERLLTAEDRDALLCLGNSGALSTSPHAVEDDLVTLFEASVRRYPHQVALQAEGQTVTYAKLDQDADKVAQCLHQLSVQPGDYIGVHADRSVNWIVAIYAVLRVGAIYTPLDPDMPQSLRDNNSRLLGCKVLIYPCYANPESSASSDRTVLCVKTILQDSCSESKLQPSLSSHRVSATPRAPAYVCFTSGSTGVAKAVLCRHESVVAFQKNEEVRLFANPGIKVSQTMSPVFDGSIHEIFSTLSYGATLVLASPAKPSFEHLKQVHSTILTPSLAQSLEASDYPGLQNIYIVGEAIPQVVNDTWSELTSKRVYNMYGPTEATCGATIKRLLPRLPVDLGPPNPSARIYILDRHHRLLPRGVIGEVFLAGIQIATGYAGNDEATARSFFRDRFDIDKSCGSMMYKTGDRGCWSATGNLVCIGRNDRQIKLHGFRLDLSDVEARIAQGLPETEATSVIEGDRHLVCFVQPVGLDEVTIKEKIAMLLPTYARPRTVITLERFPLTNAGKLDYVALRQISRASRSFHLSAKKLHTLTETLVADTWREYLNIGPKVTIGKTSNFIAMGGSSLLQLAMGHGLSRKLGSVIPAKLIVNSPTLHELAEAIDDLTPQLTRPPSLLSSTPALGRHELSPMECDWHQRYQSSSETSCFNVTAAWEIIPQVVDASRLVRAWNTVLARHEILRAQFALGPNGLEKHYRERTPQVELLARFDIRQQANKSLKLDQDCLVRVLLSSKHMLVIISHIICDLTTLRVLLGEVQSLYAGKNLPLKPKPYSQSRSWSDTTASEDLLFWNDYLRGLVPVGRQSNKQFCGRRSNAGTSDMLHLPVGLLGRMLQLVGASGMTLQQIALAAVGLATAAIGDDQRDVLDLILGCPYLNRGYADHDTVGLFLQPLPVRLKYGGPNSFGETASAQMRGFLTMVQKSSQKALSHVVPWTELLEHMNIEPQYPRYPLFTTMVTFHDDRHQRADLLDVDGCEALMCWADGAKFMMMCEFSAISKEDLLLRLEYDEATFGCGTGLFAGLIVEALESFVGERDFDKTRERLRKMVTQNEERDCGERVTLGTRIASLNVRVVQGDSICS